MRIIQEHSERKAEIIDAAEALFLTKGYANSTINDILVALNIAKGTFYHYFPSKEALLDAVIAQYIDAEIAAAQGIAEMPHLTAHDKLFRILAGAGRDSELGDRLEKEVQTVGNADLHQKTMASIVLGLAPILADIVRQGIAEGTFNTEYPHECVEILLAASEFLLHGSAFCWTCEQRLQKTKALAFVAEKALGVTQGQLGYLYKEHEKTGESND